MRLSVLALLALVASTSSVLAMGACSSSAEDDPVTNPDAATTTEGSTPDATGSDGTSVDEGGTDAGGVDATADVEAGGPVEVQLIGRFTANDGTGQSFAFPGSRLVARFLGTSAVVTLSQTDGFSGGPSWFNVIVDDMVKAPIAIDQATADYVLAENLAAGVVHKVELEKRTEGNLGVVRYEGFKFPGGSLVSALPRPSKRIEFLSDSTIDGFGIEGNRNAGQANSCGAGLAPAQYNNVRKSVSALTAATLGAEYFMLGYSAKGITKNSDVNDTLLYPTLYDRTLPDTAGNWNAASWVPDAVVISLGGVDYDNVATEPTGFNAAYGALVDKIRTAYPQAHIFMTVWSQIKNDVIGTRTAMTASLQAVMNARAADTKLYMFAFPSANVDADETGCQFHGNVTHHQAMAAQLVPFIQTKIPGW